MRIAIVNDLLIATEAIRRALVSDGVHTVAWMARDGAEAVEKCLRDRPDLVLMDLVMPVMDGVEATRRIMAASPCAILVVTATMQGNSGRVYEALGAGALDAVQTPAGAGGAAMLRVKIDGLEKRVLASRFTPATVPPVAVVGAPDPFGDGPGADCLVAVGASAGGPAALAELLGGLPADFRPAVVIVQHIDAAFTQGLVDWLGAASRLRVRPVTPGERPAAGEVRVATGDRHLLIDTSGRLALSEEPRGLNYLPSIDVFFASMARNWTREGAGVLLTGMGRDGAEGLLALRRAGFPTFAQDRESSAVYGMPKAAAELGAARQILPLREIAVKLRSGFDGRLR